MTMQVLMLRNRMVDGALLAAGSTQTVSDEDGAYLVANEWATRTDGVPDRVITGSVDVPTIDPTTGTLINSVTGLEIGDSAAVLDITASNVVELASGRNTNVTLTPGVYHVLADVDCYVLDSASSGIYGAASNGAGYFSTASGSLADQTGLDLGAADFSIEMFVQINGTVSANNVRPFVAGKSSDIRFATFLNPKATTNVLQVGLEMYGPSGTAIKSNTFIDTTLLPSTNLLHYVITVDRAAGSGTGYVRYYINKTQVGEQTYTEAGTPLNLNINDITASGRISIGSTTAGGSNYQLNGRVEDVKVYKRLLELSDITVRSDRGPARALGLPIDEYLSWWMSFQNSGSWANALNPECQSGYGNSVMTPTGDAAVTQRAGGAFASADNSPLILAHRPNMVNVSNGKVNIQPLGIGNGAIRFTRVI